MLSRTGVGLGEAGVSRPGAVLLGSRADRGAHHLPLATTTPASSPHPHPAALPACLPCGLLLLLLQGTGRPGPPMYRNMRSFIRDASHNRLLAVPAEIGRAHV